jgi:hypothetical protein
VSPFYYGLQLFPSSANKSTSQVLRPFGLGDTFFVKTDKAINGETNSFSVPSIKYSGMLFGLFLAGMFLAAFSAFGVSYRHAHPLFSNHIYIVQRVFRL